MKKFLRENPDVADEIEKKIRSNFEGLEAVVSGKTAKAKKEQGDAAKNDKADVDLDVLADDFE